MIPVTPVLTRKITYIIQTRLNIMVALKIIATVLIVKVIINSHSKNHHSRIDNSEPYN